MDGGGAGETGLSPAEILGQRARARRTELGVSLQVLAERSGLHLSYFHQVERGKNNLTLMNLLKVAAALQIDPAALVAGLRPPLE